MPMLTSIRKSLARLMRCNDVFRWEAAGDDARFHIWSGDHFFDHPAEPVVYQVRVIPRAYFEEARQRHPERMHLIHSPVSALRLLP